MSLSDKKCSAALLKKLKWVLDPWLVMSIKNAANSSIPCRHADVLLRNFWRWLCSPAAGLSNPALKRTVAGALPTAAVQLRLP